MNLSEKDREHIIKLMAEMYKQANPEATDEESRFAGEGLTAIAERGSPTEEQITQLRKKIEAFREAEKPNPGK